LKEQSCYVIEKHPNQALCLSGLEGITEIDATSQPYIEEVELVDCSTVNRIVFDEEGASKVPRCIRVAGRWSGSLEIDGVLRSISFADPTHVRNITIGQGRRDSDPYMRAGVNGLITDDYLELQAAFNSTDDLLFLPDAELSGHLDIGDATGSVFRHLGISGPARIESLNILCREGGAQSIIIRGLPDLESIHIDGHVELLEIENCPQLQSVSGQGSMLRLNAGVYRQVSIGGLWLNVTAMNTIHIRTPTTNVMHTCEDLLHSRLHANTYDMQCMWSEAFNIDISDLVEGLPILDMIDLIESKGPEFLDELDTWFVHLPTLSEQYHAMRLIVALATRGMQRDALWRARDFIVTSNLFFSEVSPVLLENRDHFQRWHSMLFGSVSPDLHRRAELARRRSGESNWFMPQLGLVPFDRLDVELWVETGGFSAEKGTQTAEDILREYPIDERSTAFDAVQFVRDSGPVRDRQEDLIRMMFDHLQTCTKGRTFDKVAQMLTQDETRISAEILENFIGVLLDAPLRDRAKVAIGAVLLQYVDDIRITTLMTTYRSSVEIGRVEAKTLHALSLAGSRAFSRGLVPHLEWPALIAWRNLHDNQ